MTKADGIMELADELENAVICFMSGGFGTERIHKAKVSLRTAIESLANDLDRSVKLLALMFDKYEEGVQCYEEAMTHAPTTCEHLELFEAALFSQRPEIGSTNCANELRFTGYRRVPAIVDLTTNVTEIVFPKSEQDDVVVARYVALIDGGGVVRAVSEFRGLAI